MLFKNLKKNINKLINEIHERIDNLYLDVRRLERHLKKDFVTCTKTGILFQRKKAVLVDIMFNKNKIGEAIYLPGNEPKCDYIEVDNMEDVFDSSKFKYMKIKKTKVDTKGKEVVESK